MEIIGIVLGINTIITTFNMFQFSAINRRLERLENIFIVKSTKE